ncbi:MAG: hypothetical protein NVSMB53_13190 [Gemmatimonadaceae bacterium]
MSGNFRHPFGARGVPIARYYAFRSRLPDDGCDSLVVRCYDDGISNIHLRDSLPDPDYEGESGKETKRFARKAQGAKARRNDY